MPMGTLVGAIQAFQQSSDWMGRLRQEQEKHRAIAALGRAGSMSDDAPRDDQQPMLTSGTGMGAKQASDASQEAQQVGQLAGWPQQAGPGGAMAPNAVPNSPMGSAPIPPHVIAGLRAMMQGGGQQQPVGQQQGQPMGQPMGQQQPQMHPQGQPQMQVQQPQLRQQGTPSMAQPSPLQQQPNPNLSSAAQPDAAGMQDPVVAASHSLESIRRSIKLGSPNIDDRTLAMAVQMQVENLKGMAPLTKAAMGMQMSLMNYGLKQQAMQQRITEDDQKWQIARRGAATKEDKNRIDEAHFTHTESLLQGRIDEQYYAVDERNKTSVTNTNTRADTAITVGAGHDKTSSDNNTANNDQRDRSSDKSSAARRAASEAQVYSQARNAFLKRHPNDVNGAQAFARQAVNDIQAGTTPSPKGGGNGAPAGYPGARKAADGHWYVTVKGQINRVDQ